MQPLGYVPVWENRKYKAPCEATCPTGIPVQERWRLVRDGRVDEAVDLALAYTPFPATIQFTDPGVIR